MNAAKERGHSLSEAVEIQPSENLLRIPSFNPPIPVRRGRPTGKRSSRDSVQVTAYINAETHYATKIALLVSSRRGGQKKDFSDLVQELLAGWLKTQG